MRHGQMPKLDGQRGLVAQSPQVVVFYAVCNERSDSGSVPSNGGQVWVTAKPLEVGDSRFGSVHSLCDFLLSEPLLLAQRDKPLDQDVIGVHQSIT